MKMEAFDMKIGKFGIESTSLAIGSCELIEISFKLIKMSKLYLKCLFSNDQAAAFLYLHIYKPTPIAIIY